MTDRRGRVVSSARRLRDCNNTADLRRMARRRLPAPMFHDIDGGADDEWTLGRNTTAFDDYDLMPDYLRDVSRIDLSTRVLGQDLKLPFLLAPTGMSRLFHHEAEPAVARAAQAAGTRYTLSTMGTTRLEDIAALAAGGQQGVAHAPGLLRSELERDMALLGCRSIAELSAAVEEACTRRKYLTAHWHTLDGARRCVEVGIRSIDHATHFSDATAKLIAANFPERHALKDRDGVLNPEHIAEAYWQLHRQPRSAWTHELDLRP